MNKMEVEFHGKQSPPKWVITYLRNESVGGGGGGGGEGTYVFPNGGQTIFWENEKKICIITV